MEDTITYVKPQWDKMDLVKFATNSLGGLLDDAQLEKVIHIIKQWNHNEAAILAPSILRSIVENNRGLHRVDLEKLDKAFQRFRKDVEKTNAMSLPSFALSFRKMKKAYYVDRVRYIALRERHTLEVVEKPSEKNQRTKRLRPREGRGQPTTAQRDFSIAALVNMVKNKLNVSSASEAIDKVLPLLRIAGCNFTKKAVEEIVRLAPNVLVIEPPSRVLIQKRVKKIIDPKKTAKKKK